MTKSREEKYPRNNDKYPDWEREYIIENWGIKSVTCIARNLQRSNYALIRFAENHNLGGAYSSSDLLTLQEVADILNVNVRTISRVWISKFDFPAMKKKFNARWVYRVDINKLLEWCKCNQDRFSTVDMELYALGQEPDWLTEKRRKDYNSIPVRQEWDAESENELLRYIVQGLSNKDIAVKMNRTNKSISRKKCRLIKAGRLKEMVINMQNNIQKVSC